MPAVYITEQGAQVGIDHRRLEVRKEGQVIAEFPMAHVDRVVVLGNVSITTPALHRLMARGVDLVFMSLGGHYYGRLSGELTPHIALRRAQYARQADPVFTLTLAQRIVAARIHNARVLLQRAWRGGAQELGELCTALEGYEARAARTQTLHALLGVEGSATARYFGGYRSFFAPSWRFTARNRRPPRDPINVLLSFGYTLATRAAEDAVRAVGLDPYVGFLHRDAYNRPSLALDLVEAFRVVIEALVRRIVLDGTVTLADFRPGGEGERPIVFERPGVQRFIAAYEETMQEVRAHPRTGERMPRWRFLEVQAREIARVIRLGDAADFHPLHIR